MERTEAGELLTEVYETLYRLGIRATMQGFFETSGAVFLVATKSRREWFSITEVYREISALYRTDAADVDPRIRRMIQKMWKSNPELLKRMAGYELEIRPTPREFLEIMRGYLTARNFSVRPVDKRSDFC